MTGAGFGSKDADGSWGFKATADGKVVLGNTSDDLIQVTGSFAIKNDTNPHIRLVHTEASEYVDLKSDVEGNMILNPAAETIYIQRAGTATMEIMSKSTDLYIRGNQQNIDMNFNVNNGGNDTTVLNLDATNCMANITKFLSYQDVTYDLGSGTSSTITPTSSLHWVTASNVTGTGGTHMVTLASGRTGGQVLHLIFTTLTNSQNLLFSTSNMLGDWSFVGVPANQQGAAMTFVWTGSSWAIMNTNPLAAATPTT